MAKPASRPPIYSGSQPPYAPARRHAAPERWDKPFSEDMQEVDVDQLLAHPLFVSTNPDSFPSAIPLRGILKNDARIREFLPGEIIVRRGDYGHSAFVILEGMVRVYVNEPGAEQLGRRRRVRPSVWGSFKRWWKQSRHPEQSARHGATPAVHLSPQGEARIFLQD